MNCRRFQSRLYEYVEGTLSASVRAAAERHVAGCSHCREVVRREQETARALSARFRLGTESLALRPEIRQRILVSSRRQPAPAGLFDSLIALWNRFAVSTAIAAFLLLAIGTLTVMDAFRERTHDGKIARTGESSVASAVSIQVSSRVPAYRFHREGNLVVDTLSYETVIASETVQPGNHETFPSNEK